MKSAITSQEPWTLTEELKADASKSRSWVKWTKDRITLVEDCLAIVMHASLHGDSIWQMRAFHPNEILGNYSRFKLAGVGMPSDEGRFNHAISVLEGLEIIAKDRLFTIDGKPTGKMLLNRQYVVGFDAHVSRRVVCKIFGQFRA